MLKFKYLFDNRDLAVMLLENWEYDKENLNLLDSFRISANAVYPFMVDGKVNFLRFTPTEEKSEEDLLAELNFIEYLCDNGYNASNIVKTKGQKRFINAHTPWGNYLAVVFKGVRGKQIERLTYSDELYFGYGKSLGKLHKLSKHYNPKNVTRIDWKQRLIWTKDILKEYSAPNNSIAEVDILLDFFSSMNMEIDNYGLIHYDFELDNVFYNESNKEFYTIDFDDCVYHWYAMDIEQSLDSIKNEIPFAYHKDAQDFFLSGYRTEMNLSEDMQKLFSVFRRYANVFGYARCIRSINETWDNEPDWMNSLRKHIQKCLSEYQKEFGNKIVI